MVKKTILILTVILSICLTTGCGCMDDMLHPDSEGKVVHTAYIIDQTAYAPLYDYETLLKEVIVGNYKKKGSTSTVIAIDGTPRLVDDSFECKASQAFSTSYRRKRNKEVQANRVLDCIKKETYPKHNECNVIDGINQGIDSVNSHKNGIRKIVVISSFLQTVDPLNMTCGVNNINDEETIKKILDIRALKSLKNIDEVSLFGIGNVNACSTLQQKLSESEKYKLENFFKTLFIKSGLKEESLKINTAVPLNKENETKFTVTQVPTLNVKGVVKTVTNTDGISLKDSVVEFSDVQLSFKPNSAKLISVKKAKKALKDIVEWEKRNQNEVIEVFSSTASCGNDKELEALSGKRSKTIKKMLISMGLKSSQIKTYALGYKKNPNKKADYVNGVFVEKLGKQNRKSYITAASSAGAQKFHKCLNK